MNYYPYFNSIPYMAVTPTAKPGILKSLFGNLNLSSIINGTQKTLNIVNQTIPLIKQAGPVINNAKTMFKVMNEFKKVDAVNTQEISNIEKNTISSNQNTGKINTELNLNNKTKNIGPTFFQ